MIVYEILIIIASILTIIWFIICGVKTNKSIKENLGTIDKKFHVQCEKCDENFEVSAKDLVTFTSKSKEKGYGANVGQFGASISYAEQLSKKIYCPKCKKKRWCKILDIEDFRQTSIPLLSKLLLQMFIKMFIGGIVIWIAFGIPISIFKTKHQKNVETEYEKKWNEHIRETYNIP